MDRALDFGPSDVGSIPTRGSRNENYIKPCVWAMYISQYCLQNRLCNFFYLLYFL